MFDKLLEKRSALHTVRRQLSIEVLESKRLLAVDIIWTNEFINDGSDLEPQFDDYYQSQRGTATLYGSPAIT